MKKVYSLCSLCLLCLYSLKTGAQIITTVAGTGTSGYSGDGGSAIAAQLSGLYGIVVDDLDNVYIVDHNFHSVRKIDGSGIINRIAGDGTIGYIGDGGPATSALLSRPTGIAADGMGNLYIIDQENFRIRKIDVSGIITTIAGVGFPGHTGDGGLATAAQIDYSNDIAVDGFGNIYFVEGSYIRKINTAGIISTVVGTGVSGFSGDGGPATAAAISGAQGIDVDDSGNIFIADRFNHRIRKVDVSGIITTIAGTGSLLVSGDGGPASAAEIGKVHKICVDRAGNIYMACDDSRIRKINTTGVITTIAGTGTPGHSGDGGPATAAEVKSPYCITVNCAGDVLFGQISAAFVYIRKVTAIRYPPEFVGGAEQVVRVCTGTALPLDTILSIVDSNSGQEATWSFLMPPMHGTISVSYTGITDGGLLVPSPALYTPDIGYVGLDSFSVVVSDCGGDADTSLVRVTIDSAAYAGTIFCADTVCEGDTVDLSVSVPGGTWSTSNTGATVSSGSLVVGVAAGTTVLTYSLTNGCGTATVMHTVFVKPAAACATDASLVPTVHKSGLLVLPNPTSAGQFRIEVSGYDGEKIPVVMVDMLGRVVKQLAVRSGVPTTVSVPGAVGYYTISATTPGGILSKRVLLK